MSSKYVLAKYEIKTDRLIGFLSRNKKRWSIKSCGIFEMREIVNFHVDNNSGNDKKYYYSETNIYK